MRILHTDDAPRHVGPVPQAVEAGGWIHVSALFGARASDHVIPDDAEAEAKYYDAVKYFQRVRDPEMRYAAAPGYSTVKSMTTQMRRGTSNVDPQDKIRATRGESGVSPSSAARSPRASSSDGESFSR